MTSLETLVFIPVGIVSVLIAIVVLYDLLK